MLQKGKKLIVIATTSILITDKTEEKLEWYLAFDIS